jgi:indole-3-glycerol phosphate synthase
MSLKGYYPGGRPSLLRKDFLVDPYEITQSRAAGADALLLIVAILDEALLRDLIQKTQSLQMEALVEVHNEAEIEQAVRAGTSLFGINNRDLHTFEVDLATTERLRPLLPREAVVVGESGVHTREDVERLYRAGVNAVLIGEAFMTALDVRQKMQELRL